MKYMFIAILAVASLTSCSHWHKKNQEMQPPADMTFEELRTWKTQYLAKKSDLIKQEQACIDKATDKPGLKKCTEDIKAKWTESMQDPNKQK